MAVQDEKTVRSETAVLDEETVHGEATLLRAIRAATGREFDRLVFKDNRVRLLSVSRDGATLHLHSSFRTAPREVVAAIAAFLGSERGSAEATRAAARIRRWAADRADGGAAADPGAAGPGQSHPGAVPTRSRLKPPRPGRCCGTPAQRRFLAELYRDLNRSHCGGRLPAELPLRFSDRMRRRLGHVRCHLTDAGTRVVVELALNIDLMAEGNERQLRETMLHELAHVEAWLEHGDRGHGAHWRRIARRLGCEPRACTRTPVPLRRPRSAPTTRVPARHLVG